MNIETISQHPDFPQMTWVVIEQPRNEAFRFEYDPHSGRFTRSTHRSLFFDRGFSGAYGWMGGLGAPPNPHFDVILFTEQSPQPGDVLLGHISGVFFRSDGDHKFVAIDQQLIESGWQASIAALDAARHSELLALYPRVGPNEGWRDAEEARQYLASHAPSHD